MQEVLAAEAPIAEDVLIERIRRAWGFGRAGGNIVETIRRATPQDVPHSRTGDKTFFWNEHQDPAAFTGFRGSDSNDDARRKLDEIAPEELSAAMAWLVRRFVSAQEEELLRATAEIFGWTALTGAARQVLAPALERLLQDGFARGEDGWIRETPPSDSSFC